MKQVICSFIILCIFAGVTIGTNNCCTRAAPLNVLPFSSVGAVTSAALQLDAAPLHIDASIVAGAWFTFNHLVPLTISLDICGVTDVQLNAYLFHGSCDNLVIIDVHERCCGSLLNIEILPGRTYYLFIGASAAVDINLNVNILSPVLNGLCVNPVKISDRVVAGTTLGVAADLVVRDVAVNTCDAWYFLYSALNNVLTLSTCPVFGGSAVDLDAKLRIYTGNCNALTLVASVDIDCASITANHLTISLSANTVYYVVVSTVGIHGDFNLFSSVSSSVLPPISLDLLASLSGAVVVNSAANHVLRVNGRAVVGLTYEIRVGNLEPVVFVCASASFAVEIDITNLVVGQSPLCLVERGTGRLVQLNLVNQVVAGVTGLGGTGIL